MSGSKNFYGKIGHWLLAVVPAYGAGLIGAACWLGFWHGYGHYEYAMYFASYGVFRFCFIVTAVLCGPKPRVMSAVFYGIVAFIFVWVVYFGRYFIYGLMGWEFLNANLGALLGSLVGCLVGWRLDQPKKLPPSA